MPKTVINYRKMFFASAAVICLLFSSAHMITFVKGISNIFNGLDFEGGSYEEEVGKNEFSPTDFVDLMIFWNSYDFDEYDENDFSDWLYMPARDDLPENYTQEDIIPYAAYAWSEYDPNDFPSQMLNMPAELPTDFNETEFDMYDYVDEEFMEEVVEILGIYGIDPDGDDESGDSDGPDIGAILQYFLLGSGEWHESDLIMFIVFLVAAIICAILRR